MKHWHVDGTLPENGEIFVFGSNRAGRHGKGAALMAKQKYGAVPGRGWGRMFGSYAIPTKDVALRSLFLPSIQEGVQTFVTYAKEHPELKFFLTRVGCGLAGYTDSEIAPMFKDAPDNCSFPDRWKEWLK